MPPESPEEQLAERAALLREIAAAFEGVTREGGVSWTESKWLDGHFASPAPAEVRSRDRDASWEEVAEDPRWDPDTGYGGWPFLDAVGFRYYAAAAMLRSARSGLDEGLAFHIDHPDRRQWALFTDRQRRCVDAFKGYMARRHSRSFGP